jgi:hypothetical protein
MTEKKRRRRTCADRLRRDLAERQRQRRGGDPAGKVALQLLGLLSGTLALLPPTPRFSFSPGRPHSAPRKAVSSPPGEAARSQFYEDDEDRGPTAYAMERGLEPTYYRTSSRAAPSWSRLVKDLSRRSTSERARALIEHRVPAGAVEWLRSRIELEDWRSLLLLGLDGRGADEIATAALVEAARWEAERLKPAPEPEPEPPPTPETEDSDDPETKGPKP